MRIAGMTVAVAVCWLAGVVGAVSLPPDDQYSPQQSPYKRDALRGPRGYPNWLEYHQAPSTGLQPPKNKPGTTSVRQSDLSSEEKTPKDSMIRDLDFLSLAPRRWNEATVRAMNNPSKPNSDLNIAEERLGIVPASREDPFDAEDAFQDQGPGSVEVYKLDLHKENSLLVPLSTKDQPPVTFRIKSKLPKKAKGDDIQWKLKPIESSKTSLSAIFKERPNIYHDETIPPESMNEIKEVRKGAVITVGGVPELQVGCEGLEASNRKRRSSGPGKEDNDEEYRPKFEDPVYRESTEPILLRVTPIVLDFEDEPPSGQIYEELDELLKLKSFTTPEPTTKRTNRGDIDPALENYEHEDIPIDEMLPERGDLGSNGSKGNVRIQRSIRPEDSLGSKMEGVRFPREAKGEESLVTARVSGKDDDTLSPIIGRHSESLNHRGGRKLLSVQYPERYDSKARTRHHQGVDENQDPDLWGFGEDDGEKLLEADESDANELRRVEEEKRRREYERRRQEEINRRYGEHERYPHSQEKERRERQRLEEEKRRQEDRRQWEDEQRRVEEAQRRQSEELQRRRDEEARRKEGYRDSSHPRRREEEERRRDWIKRREEEERRIRLENERNHEAPPAALTRPSPYHRPDNPSRNHQEEDRRVAEERKLREYIERNRPINAKHDNDEARKRNEDQERRKHIEAQRKRPVDEERRRQQEDKERRRQYEEQRRRHQTSNETEWKRQHEEQERRRQMEEQQRRQEEEQRRRQQSEEENERRRQMEEHRRRDRPDQDREREEERRRQLEEERKLQEYVRRNQPVNIPKRNSSQDSDWQEQRRILEEARQWQQHKTQKDGRSRGPSAPTSVGQRRTQENTEELRRRQEAERLEDQRRRFEEEGRKREEDYRRQESRRREEERQRLVAQRRREEANGRRPSLQDSRRPANTTQRADGRDPGELRRQETSQGLPSNSRRNQEDAWRRTQEQRQRQREERERLRLERERNERNNGRRRPQYGDTRPSEQRQRGESARNQEETERRRREEARLNALPVSARIMINTDQASSRDNRTSPTAPPVPPVISIGTRAGFGNEIDFPAISPNRPGLAAHRFPAPATQKPPTKSPSACVWAIVNCCPANNRLNTCFESMGCPGISWDPSPCRASLQSAARAQVLSFYDTAEDNYSRA